MKFITIFALAAMIFSAESIGIRKNHLEDAPATTDTTIGTTPAI